MCRQTKHVFTAERAGEIAGAEHAGVKGLGGFVIRDENQRGRVHGAEEERQIEGAGGRSEA